MRFNRVEQQKVQILCITSFFTVTFQRSESSLLLSAEIVNYEFDTKNLVCLLISSVVGLWYLLKKVTLSQSRTGNVSWV